jgi:hypothetical protein
MITNYVALGRFCLQGEPILREEVAIQQSSSSTR